MADYKETSPEEKAKIFLFSLLTDEQRKMLLNYYEKGADQDPKKAKLAGLPYSKVLLAGYQL